MIAVPASADAPHMADEKYWGRSATGRRPLTDAETQRLWAQRHQRREHFLDHLKAMPHTFDPMRTEPQRFGHLYLYLKPATPPIATVTDILAGRSPTTWISETMTFRPQYAPSLDVLDHRVPHPDGVAVSTRVFSQRDRVDAKDFEEWLVYLLLGDDGTVQVVSGQGT